MLNPQIRRNLQQNQITETRSVRPQLFLAQAEVTPQAQEPHDVFVPRDPCQDRPLAPELKVNAQA